MDHLWTLLNDHVPAQISQGARLYFMYYNNIHPYILLTLSYFYRYVFPTIYPLYTLANNFIHYTISSDAPDLVSLLILAATLYISLRVLDYMRRSIIRWIALAIRLGLWASVLVIGLYVYQRGVEKSLEDFGWAWGLLEGLGEEGEVVGRQKARGSERQARMRKAPVKGRSRGTGW